MFNRSILFNAYYLWCMSSVHFITKNSLRWQHIPLVLLAVDRMWLGDRYKTILLNN